MSYSTCRRRCAPAVGAALAVAIAAPALALDVLSSTPTRFAFAIQPTLSAITVTFDAPVLLPAPAAFRVAGSMSGLHGGTLDASGATLTLHNLTRAFQPGEVVTVNLRSSIHATTGGAALVGGRMFSFTIASGPCTPDWSNVTVYPASITPYYIYGGDLDGDGRPDLAVPNEGTNDVSVFRNTAGIGAFPVHTDYPVGTRPSSVFGEDLDNDGDQDLATADINGSTVTVLRNTGSGTFSLVAHYPVANEARQVAGADFDGDNDIDLCATSRGSNEVYLFTNAGNGTFTSQALSTVSRGPFAIRCADLNNDGHVDIAVACQTADSLTVLLNDGIGNFFRSGAYAIADGPWDLSCNDFDADGDCDLVCAASFANRLTVLRNDGTGKFPTRTQLVSGAWPLAAFTADLDGDGDIDAMASNYVSASVSLFRNDGAGNFTAWGTLATSIAGSYAWAHDLDGDGDLDLSVVDEEADELFVFLNGGTTVDAGDARPAAGGPGWGTRLRAFPNPVRGGNALHLRLEWDTPPAGPAPHADMDRAPRADIYNVAGRWIRRLLPTAGSNSIEWRWNGHDAAGRGVAAGRYVAVVRGAGPRRTVPIQVVR